MRTKSQKAIKKIIIVAIWLIIWQVASMITGLEILFASPVAVCREFGVLLQQHTFYETIWNSFIRITSGFFLSFLIAVVLGCVAGKYHLVEDFFAPAIHLMQSLPVAAFIIIVLMWFGSEQISFIIGGMVVIPIIYTSVVQGIRHMDKDLLEMAQVFHVKWMKRVRYIYFPQVFPYVENNCKVALGMCWKAGVSAEVIGLARHSIGEQMYYSKLYLLSADLFAWSIVVILLSVLFENVLILLLRFIKNALAK